MIVAILFALFAVFGLLTAILDFEARANSPGPSMHSSAVGCWGCLIFMVCGLIAIAAFFGKMGTS